MRRKRRLSRPFHGALCLLAVLLAIVLVRVLCGPGDLMSERAALRRAQRQSLRVPREATTTVNVFNQQVFAVWDGSEVQAYHAWWKRPLRRGYSYNADGERGLVLMAEPPVRDYFYCYLFRDSRDFGWGCPGAVMTGYRVRDTGWGSSYSLPLLVKNDDPAAASGTVTVRGTVRDDRYDRPYGVTASAGRENPWFFTFLLETDWSVAAGAFHYIAGGTEDGKCTAEAEIIWYDAGGAELYRQQIELIPWEGRKTYGA